MKKKDKFLTFITACIPGVGYMYNGLITKGIETLLIFIFINIFFDLIGLHVIGGMVKFLFWIYTFIDSLRIAAHIDSGENVQDSGFIFEKHFENGNFKVDFNSNAGANNKTWSYLGFGLVIIGALSLINKLFVNNEFFNYIKFSIYKYSLPILLIALGLFLLFRKRK